MLYSLNTADVPKIWQIKKIAISCLFIASILNIRNYDKSIRTIQDVQEWTFNCRRVLEKAPVIETETIEFTHSTTN